VQGWGVARLTGVDDDDAPPGAGEDEGGGQAGSSSTDDHDVVLAHDDKAVDGGRPCPRLLPFPGIRRSL
jgi:hypothetical protein